MSLDVLTVDDFAPHVGEAMDLVVDGRRVAAVLASALPVGEAPPSGSARRRTFSVVFRTAGGVRLPQRIYGVEHPRLGRLDLFLVPIQPDAGGDLYEAVFN